MPGFKKGLLILFVGSLFFSANLHPAGKKGFFTPFFKAPLWEVEWAKIREDVLRRFSTGCMAKFSKNIACKGDPIKSDVVLKYGRAISKGDYQEAMAQYAAWVRFEPFISLNTARVYDLALSALAKAIITKENANSSKEGLKAILNLGIATCDVLLPTQKGCLFQKLVKNHWSSFIAAAKDYPNEEVGLACVNFEQNEVRRYTRGCREKPGQKGQQVCVSAMAGYLSTYKNTNFQGPMWGCSSCEMVKNNFFCGKGLPPAWKR